MRALLLALAVALLAPGAIAPARAQSPDACAFLDVRAGERPLGGMVDRCILDLEWASSAGRSRGRIYLDRREGSAACAAVDLRRREEGETETRGVFADFERGEFGERGFEVTAPQYAIGELGVTVVTIHPARYMLNFCQTPYEFRASVSYNGSPVIRGEAVPQEVIEDLRHRARATLERVGGNRAQPLSSTDAERELIETLGPSLAEGLGEVAGLGLLESQDIMALTFRYAKTPAFEATGKRFIERLGITTPAQMNAAQKQAVRVYFQAAIMAQLKDVDGNRAFPAAAANLDILLELAVRGTEQSNPAEAHQALTAMERYAAMLRDLDVKVLKDRHGISGAQPATEPEKT